MVVGATVIDCAGEGERHGWLSRAVWEAASLCQCQGYLPQLGSTFCSVASRTRSFLAVHIAEQNAVLTVFSMCRDFVTRVQFVRACVLDLMTFMETVVLGMRRSCVRFPGCKGPSSSCVALFVRFCSVLISGHEPLCMQHLIFMRLRSCRTTTFNVNTLNFRFRFLVCPLLTRAQLSTNSILGMRGKTPFRGSLFKGFLDPKNGFKVPKLKAGAKRP